MAKAMLVTLTVLAAAAPSSAATTPKPGPGDMPDALTAAADTIDAYLHTLDYLAIQHFYDLTAEAERVAAAELARSAPVGPGTPRTGGRTSMPTACDGHVIPAALVQRESGCDYGAVSPASYCGGNGCYGLYQISGAHWNGGACTGLDWTVPADQDECARRISNGGTNLAPWGA